VNLAEASKGKDTALGLMRYIGIPVRLADLKASVYHLHKTAVGRIEFPAAAMA